MLKLIEKIFGSANERYISKKKPDVDKIASLEERIKAMSDEQLKAQTAKFREQLERGATLDDIKHEAFATIREAGWRVHKMRHYDVQMLGGLVLHEGQIAEMRTGEGKTLVATSPLYLNGLSGEGAHLVTVNDYLASRDAEWMGRIYNFLGLSVGTIVADISDADRRAAYRCDITYGTNNEFGFDYLRDNMKYDLNEYVQRKLNFAIIDEVDSILIDEARTPLIISGQVEQSTDLYHTVNNIIPYLRKDDDYLVDEESRSVTLTDQGIENVEARLEIDNLYSPEHLDMVHHVNKALQAHTLYKRDDQYMVRQGEVVIIDEFTGRPMAGRRWSDGLHQAIEAKEGVKIVNESQTLATVTFQNFFRMYDKLAGMTGTAETEAEEFHATYGLNTIVVPTNRPIARLDMDDVIYRSYREKFHAIVQQIEACHALGQPVLVGTTSVEKSEAIGHILDKKQIDHSVLNAKFHGKEALIVSQAGRLGAVTIATNMAGRGTDIILGGNPEALTNREMPKPPLPDGVSEIDEEQYWPQEYKDLLAKFTAQCKAEREEVLEAGGLFIVGTERHESRRIDNQLRGRAGRQGDPGGSRFFLSLEDDLLRLFGADRIAKVMDTLRMEEGVPIESPMVSRSIEGAQRKVEGRNFEIRKNLLEYDDVMDMQRKTIYGLRKNVLRGRDSEGRSLSRMALDLFEDVALAMINHYAPTLQRPEDWDMHALQEALMATFGIDFDLANAQGRDGIERHVWTAISDNFRSKKEAFDELEASRSKELQASRDQFGITFSTEDEEHEAITLFEQQIRNQYLRAIDRLWRGHLQAMEQMRDSIGLQGYAQKDPKKEYKRRGYDLFMEMMLEIKSSVVEFISRSEGDSIDSLLPVPENKASNIQFNREGISEDQGENPRRRGGDWSEQGEQPEPVKIELPRVGRNEPCPCGSGEKYKNCHMKKEGELPIAASPNGRRRGRRSSLPGAALRDKTGSEQAPSTSSAQSEEPAGESIAEAPSEAQRFPWSSEQGDEQAGEDPSPSRGGAMTAGSLGGSRRSRASASSSLRHLEEGASGADEGLSGDEA